MSELKSKNDRYNQGKINIVLPICAVIVIAICGSILLVFFKDKIPPCKRTGKNPGAIRTLKTELNPNSIAIPKSRLDEFKQLIKMGYEVNETCEAINKTPSIGFALDRLNMKNVTLDNKNENDGKTKNDGNEIKNADSEYIFIGNFLKNLQTKLHL